MTSRSPSAGFDLEGEVVIVTGAARGQGETEARLLIGRGAMVILCDVLDDLGRTLAEGLGDRAQYLHLDVSSPAEWAELTASVRARYGQIRGLVNNAGIYRVEPLMSETVDGFSRVLAVNLLGAFQGIQAAAALMDSGGSIVNISSIAGLQGLPNHSSYGAAKGAIRGLSRTAALELGSRGIRVNVVLPGAVDTPMITISDEAEARYRRLPLGRVGTSDDVAGVVAFLLSDASAYITGSEITVDGGATAGPAGMPPPTAGQT